MSAKEQSGQGTRRKPKANSFVKIAKRKYVDCKEQWTKEQPLGKTNFNRAIGSTEVKIKNHQQGACIAVHGKAKIIK